MLAQRLRRCNNINQALVQITAVFVACLVVIWCLLYIGLSAWVTSHYFWLTCNFYLNARNQSDQFSASFSQHYSASVSLAWPLVLNMCYESSRVAQRLCLSEYRSARIMSLLRYRYYPKTTWNTFWNSAWPSMIQLQSYITLSSRINKVGRHKTVYFVFFIEFGLYMTLIWTWNDLCTPPQYSGTPTRVTLSTKSYVYLLQFKA